MAITISKEEQRGISASLETEAVINRLVTLVNDLESRIETLESA